MTAWDLFIILTGFLVILTVLGGLAALLERRRTTGHPDSQARRSGRAGPSYGPTRGSGR